MQNKMKEEAEKWMEKSEKDMSDAKFNLDNNRLETSAFLSHQAAEKALKSAHIRLFNHLIKVHDLADLGRKVGASKAMLKCCDALNPHYIETRYLVDIGYSKKMAKDAFRNSEKIVKWAKKLLKK